MDMTQYAGSESNYLKAMDLQGKSVKLTISNVELVEFDDDEKGKHQKPVLAFEGKEKKLVCNKTSVNDLINAFGTDSDAWMGKEVRLSTKHYASFGKDGIVLMPIVEDAESGDIPF